MPYQDAFNICHHSTIADVQASDWDSLFPGKSEDWNYFRACEQANSQQFVFSALCAYRDQKLVAATPVFQLNFRIDMVVGDALRRITDAVTAVAPGLMKWPIIGMGHPMTEECPIGFEPSLNPAERSAVLIAMLQELQKVAAKTRAKIVVMKDVTDADTATYKDAIASERFGRLESLPIAQMHIPYPSLDSYLQSLPSKRRTQMRKKMRQAGEIEITFVDSIDGIEDQLKALYEETRNRRARSYEAFDEVPDDYFMQVIATNTGNIKVMLAKIDGTIVGFMFLLVEKDRLIFKFVGMTYPLALDRSLYFYLWMQLVQYCIANGISMLQAGQTNYITKVRMGCELRRSWIFFKYTGRILGPIVRLIGSRLSIAAEEPDLIELGDHARYTSQS